MVAQPSRSQSMSIDEWREDEVELISVGVRIPVATFYEMTDVPEVFGGPKGKV